MSDDTDSQAPEGVLGVTGQLVALLAAHYDLAYLGPGSADSRPARMVEARREDGSLAARFWLDQVTRLPLRREVFDSGAHLVSEDVFIDLKVGAPAANSGPAGPATPAPQSVPGTRLTAVDVTRLRARGWPVPGALPGGLSLFEAGSAATHSGQVLDLGYSDGLFVVSVFMQRGDLPPTLAGWQKITLDGRDVYTRPARPGLHHLGRPWFRLHGHGRRAQGHPGPGRGLAALQRTAGLLETAVAGLRAPGLVGEPVPLISGRGPRATGQRRGQGRGPGRGQATGRPRPPRPCPPGARTDYSGPGAATAAGG